MSSGTSAPAPRGRPAESIKLQDLLPKANVVGGKGPAKVLFGASPMRPAGKEGRTSS